MKQKVFVKRTIYALTATALLASTGWAQPPPEKGPRKPIGKDLPDIKPTNPRLPMLLDPPVIQSPLSHQGFDLDKPLVISGTSVQSSHLQIVVNGEWQQQVRRQSRSVKRQLSDSITYADSRGNWKTKPLDLNIPATAKGIKLEISVVQTVSGKSSKPATVSVSPFAKVAVLKPPVIVATAAPMLNIDTPKDGSKVSSKDKRIILQGTAIGDTALNVQMTMYVHTERGNFLTKKQGAVRQVHRRVDNVPIKNGKWEASLDITTKDENITKVIYEIIVFLKNDGATRTLKLSR